MYAVASKHVLDSVMDNCDQDTERRNLSHVHEFFLGYHSSRISNALHLGSRGWLVQKRGEDDSEEIGTINLQHDLCRQAVDAVLTFTEQAVAGCANRLINSADSRDSLTLLAEKVLWSPIDRNHLTYTREFQSTCKAMKQDLDPTNEVGILLERLPNYMDTVLAR